MRVRAWSMAMGVAVVLLATGCGGDNIDLCDGCGTPTPTPTITATPTATSTTPATDRTPTPAPSRTPARLG